MSRRRFAGWEPATVTRHVYDDAGRLVETVTTPEPEWSDEDREWAMALDLVEARACPSCGRPRSVCWGEDKAEHLNAKHGICAYTLVSGRHHETIREERPDVPANAIHVTAEPKPT